MKHDKNSGISEEVKAVITLLIEYVYENRKDNYFSDYDLRTLRVAHEQIRADGDPTL